MTPFAILVPYLTTLMREAPDGFVPTDEHYAGFLGYSGLDRPAWQVTLENDRLRVESYQACQKRARKEPEPLDAIRIPMHGSVGIVRKGSGTPVSDGSMVAYNVGEFGGGLFWISKDGRKYREISRDNTELVIRTRKGIFAVQALSHLQFWFARLVKVEKGSKGWETKEISDLHVDNPSVVQDGERFVYATKDYVSTLETNGIQREIYRPTPGTLSVTSMVRRRNGDIWIGNTFSLLRLRPKPSGKYDAQWYRLKPTEYLW